MFDDDNKMYYRFTTKQRLNKEISTLHGILIGISNDGSIDNSELQSIKDWLDETSELANKHPFSKIIPIVISTMEDGKIDYEETEDLIWLCNKYIKENPYYDALTIDMQKLHGIIIGIISDNIISKEELLKLQDWLIDHEHLKSYWPYDEIDSLILSIMKDGKIDENEHTLLLNYFKEFSPSKKHKVVSTTMLNQISKLSGICAACPDIAFENMTFCFTGKSNRKKREDLHHIVVSNNGKVSNNAIKDLNYLVVCAEGNSCWSFECYGRKVEQVINWRKSGSKTLIIHENDFFDAIGNI